MNLLRGSKPDRPNLKVCEKCHGKGQTSCYDRLANKKYEPCDQCCKRRENSKYSLGVKLKCTCEKESANYDWVLASQTKHFPQGQPELRALAALQTELGTTANALLISCDCGAKYLCIDGPERRMISGDRPFNEVDKKYNKAIAETLVKNGIHKILQRGPNRL